MKLLHAADLHLGRSFRERPLLDDQRAMLDGLLAALAADDYAALLLAGDIYDRSIPGPEAVELLGRFLAETRRRFPDLTIVACAGNHDSPERLAYGDELFSALGIHSVCDPARCFRPIWVERAGAAKGFAAVELKAGEEPSVRLLPFDPPRRVTRLSGDFASFMEAGAYPEHREDYLEIALDDGHLVENPLAILRTRYPQLLSVRQDRALEASFPADGAGFGPARARRNAVDDFAEFLRELYGKDDAEKLGLFKAIAEELSDETA